MRSGRVGAAVVLTAASLLGGCAAGDQGAGDSASESSAAADAGGAASGDATDSGAGDSASGDASSEAADPAGEGARDDFVDANCAAGEDGAYSLTGHLENTTDQDMIYTVLAAVALVEGGSVEGRHELEVEVAAGESADVDEAQFFTHGGEAETQCVVSVRRRPAE